MRIRDLARSQRITYRFDAGFGKFPIIMGAWSQFRRMTGGFKARFKVKYSLYVQLPEFSFLFRTFQSLSLQLSYSVSIL